MGGGVSVSRASQSTELDSCGKEKIDLSEIGYHSCVSTPLLGYLLASRGVSQAWDDPQPYQFDVRPVARHLHEKQGALWEERVTLRGWRRIEGTTILLRVSHPGRTGRTTAQPPPAQRGVGAREGACEALGLMHPAYLVAIAAVRDGGDQNYLPPRRPGDTISGEAAGASRQSHTGGLQKCSQEAKLQILLQIYGRWLRVTVKCV